jgi:hypothetical protein
MGYLGGAVIGGGFLVVGLIGAVGQWFWKKRQTRKHNNDNLIMDKP